MFGYRLIKNDEIENLKDNLAHANVVIAELLNKIKEQDAIIANLTELTKVKEETVEEKPVKKVRRKSSKKTTKKEE